MAIDRHKLNSKFRSEENLAEEFSWDNMEKGIYEKMNSKKSRRPAGIFIFSAIALALFIVGGGMFIYLSNENKNSTEYKTVLHNTNKESIVSNNKNNIAVNPEVENINDETTKTESRKVEKTFALNNENGTTELTIAKEIKIKTTYAENKIAKSRNEKTAIVNRSKVDQNNEIVNSSNTQSSISIVDLIKEKSAFDVENISDKVKEAELINENSIVDYKNLNPSEIVLADIESKIFLIINNINPELPLIEIINPTINKNEENHLKNSILITGGMLSSPTNYSSTPLDAIKSKYEKDALGYSFGIGYNRVISDKILLNTGIDYNTIRSILDYQESTAYAEQRDNLLLSMDINTITGDTIKTYGTGTITGKQTRKVLHYNTQKVISIPLIVLYNIQKSKFNYNIGFGPVLNYNLSANGKTINTIDDFQTIDKAYYKTMTYGMKAKLGINYSINKRFFAGLNFNYTSPLNKWNEASVFSMKKGIVNGSIDVGYKF